jgi:hypothetical protein
LAVTVVESDRAIVHPEIDHPILRSAQYSIHLEQSKQKHNKFIHIANEVYTDDD